MPSKFSLEAILSLTDNITSPYKTTTVRITAMNRGLQGSFGRLNNTIKRTGRFVGKQLKRAALVGLGTLALSTGLAAREFVALDESITQAGAKFKDLNTTSITYKSTLKELSAAARAVGSDTEFSATDSAGALDKMAMAGLSSAQSMALLRGTTNLATAANTDLTTAVDIATDSLGAFNLVTEDTIQLEKNLARVSDVMAKTTTTANTNLEEMFEAVKTGGPAFTAAGQQVEDFSALVGTLANAGLKGSQSGTALRNVMLRLAKPTGEAAGVIKKLGVQTQDAQGNFRNVIDILGDFEKGLKGMGTAQKTAALSTVFGARSVTAVNVLLAEGSEKLKAYRDSLIDSAGASKTMAEAMRQSIGNRLKILKSGLTELGLQFIEAFETEGRGALNKLIEMVQNFDMSGVIKTVRKAGIFVVKIFKMMKQVFIKLQPSLIAVRDSFMNILKILSPLLIPAFKLLGDAIAFVMPIINAFKNAVVELINHFKQTGQIEKVVIIFNRLKETLAPLKAVFIDIINTLVQFLKRSGALPVITALFGLLVSAVKLVGAAFRILWQVAKPILKGLAVILRPILFIIEKIIDGISLLARGIGSVVGGVSGFFERRQAKKDQENAETSGRIGGVSDESRALKQAQLVEEKRVTEESRQRQDLFLHAPMGAGISKEPGGTPELAVSLGAQ